MADKRPVGEVTAAATELEAALSSFERTTAAAARISLSSQRNLEKAAQAVTEAAGCQPDIASAIQKLMAALQAAQQRNGEAAEALHAFGERVAKKSEACATWLGRFGELGDRARALTDAVRTLGGAEAAALPTADKLARLRPIERDMGALVDEAGTLARGARGDDFDDIAKQAEALRQQMQAARNKVTLVLHKLEGAAPS